MNGSIDLDEKTSLKPADLVQISDHLSEGPIGVASSELQLGEINTNLDMAVTQSFQFTGNLA